MRKIIKGIVKYRQGMLGIQSNDFNEDRFTINYGRYRFLFLWETGKPFGRFQIVSVDAVNVFELTYESEYQKYGTVTKHFIQVLFDVKTDNSSYITRMIEQLIFPSVD